MQFLSIARHMSARVSTHAARLRERSLTSERKRHRTPKTTTTTIIQPIARPLVVRPHVRPLAHSLVRRPRLRDSSLMCALLARASVCNCARRSQPVASPRRVLLPSRDDDDFFICARGRSRRAALAGGLYFFFVGGGCAFVMLCNRLRALITRPQAAALFAFTLETPSRRHVNCK